MLTMKTTEHNKHEPINASAHESKPILISITETIKNNNRIRTSLTIRITLIESEHPNHTTPTKSKPI